MNRRAFLLSVPVVAILPKLLPPMETASVGYVPMRDPEFVRRVVRGSWIGPSNPEAIQELTNLVKVMEANR